MNKLFKAELKRRLFSFLFLGEIIAIIGFNYNHILWHTYGFKVSADFFLFQVVSPTKNLYIISSTISK